MRISLSALAITLVSTPVAAADIKAASKVEAVIVFPQGAEVARLAKVRIESGSHTVILSDLPAQAQPASIRVEGKATGSLTIGSVDSRRLSVPRADAETAATTRRRIEDEIEKLRDERARIGADMQAAEAQKAFVTSLTQLPSRPPAPAPAGGAAREDWGQVLSLIAKELAPIQKAILDAEVRIREVDRKIRDAEGRLRAEGPGTEERTEVKVAVAAAQALDAELTVRYQVAEASWTPLYDARLATGSRAAAPKLTIARRAGIMQRTAEAWEGVALSLSTTRPSQGAAAPVLRPLTVDFPPDRPMPMSMPAPQAMGRAVGSVRRDEGAMDGLKAKVAAAEKADDELAKLSEAGVQQAQIEVGAFQAIYSILGRQTVMNTGDVRRVQIDESDFETTLTARSVPRVDERAFLYAKLTVPRATPWLPGQVALFRDATFVGNGRLPQLAPGQDHDLGFGADDRVRVRAASTDEKRGETGIISSTRTDTRSFKLTIKNLHERPIAYMIQDQTPVANNTDIKVEMIAKPQPGKRDVEDKRGVVAWEDKHNPDEEKAIEFGYKVSWPAAKSVVYGR